MSKNMLTIPLVLTFITFNHIFMVDYTNHKRIFKQ